MLSIALCTYNGENFLQAQLDSIARQRHLPDELVVCDDASSDNSLDILLKFQKTASFPVSIHQNKTKLGVRKNFEKAVSLCQGEIIAFSDQDDVWKPEKLEKISKTFQEAPEAGYLFSDAELVNDQLAPLGSMLWDSIGFDKAIRQQFSTRNQFQILLWQKIVTGATMAIRSDIAKLAIPFPNIPYWLHDGWLALTASAIGAKGIAIEEPLILYRQHQSQQIGAANKKEPKRKLSLMDKYKDFKKNSQKHFVAWEKTSNNIMEIKRNLERIRAQKNSPTLANNIKYLKDFETHFHNRRRIITEKKIGNYALILNETFSGRYVRFSDSWRSIVRDIFL